MTWTERIAERHRRMVAGELHPTHGLLSTYRQYGCRCARCREANTQAVRVRPPRDDRHGTGTNYQYGCRCDACRSAHADYARTYRARHRLRLANG